jgi:hypothetical protein
VIPALVALAAVVDLAFSGYRAAAGRNARIVKTGYYVRALGVGAAVGVAVTLPFAAVSLAAPGLAAELVVVGARMLMVIGVYATLVLAAILVYVVAEHEVRTLATVAILGPFTLIRPAVIAVALAVGLWPGRSAAATLFTLGAGAAVLLAGAGLERGYRRRRLDD